MKKIPLLMIVMIVMTILTACAHNGGGSLPEKAIRVESPYFPAEISVDGQIVGTTPLVIAYSKIQQPELDITAVALEDRTFRQELTFSIPPLPRKIVVLALRPSPLVVSIDASPAEISARGRAGQLKSAESECLPEPIFTPIIFFDTDKSEISTQALESLRAFAEMMKKNALHMDIVGFADERHCVPYNLQLSLRRAQAVVDALQSIGLAAARMHVEGRGEIQTLDNQGHKMAWAHDRRVEIRIVE